MWTPPLFLALVMLSGLAPAAPDLAPERDVTSALGLDVREVPRSGARPPPPLNTRRIVRKRLETEPARPRRGTERRDVSICTLAEVGRDAAAERLRADRKHPTRPALSFRLLIAGAAAGLLHLPPPALRF